MLNYFHYDYPAPPAASLGTERISTERISTERISTERISTERISAELALHP